MAYTQLLLCTLAVTLLSSAVAVGLGSNFNDVSVTGAIKVVRNQQLSPTNYWDTNQAAAPNSFFDPEWLNNALNSTTVPITDGAIEFGFGRIADGTPPVNVTVTLDVETSGRAVYQVACTAPQGAACVFITPFTVLLAIQSESLIGGSVDVLFNNASDLFVPSFDASTGNFSFETGPLDGSEGVTGGFIEGGDLRQIIFQLNEAGRCVQGDCCDVRLGKVKPRGVVCRQPSNQCEAVAICDGEEYTCPESATAANGRRCLWEPNEPFMSDPCDTTTSTASTTSAPAAAGPLGGWGTCTGVCQEGTCTLDCSRGKCCYTSNPLPPLLPPDFTASVQALGQLSQTVADTLQPQNADGDSDGRQIGLSAPGVEGLQGLEDFVGGVVVPAFAVPVTPAEVPRGGEQEARDGQASQGNLVCWEGPR